MKVLSEKTLVVVVGKKKLCYKDKEAKEKSRRKKKWKVDDGEDKSSQEETHRLTDKTLSLSLLSSPL